MKATSLLSPGTRCGAFEIASLALPALIEGRIADGPWYRAVDANRRVHLLQEVVTPAPSAPWWDEYVTYQHEVRRRLEESPSAHAAAGWWKGVFITTEAAGRQTWRTFSDEKECVPLASEEWMNSLEKADQAPSSFTGATVRLAVVRALWEGLGAVHRAGVILGLTAPEAIGAGLTGSSARVRFYDWQWAALPDVPPPWTSELFRQAAARHVLASPGQRRADLPSPADDLFFMARLSLQLLTGATGTSPQAAFQGLEPGAMESAGLDLAALEQALSACLRTTSGPGAASPTQVTGPASTLPSAGRIALLFAGRTAAPRQTALVAHAAHPVRPKLEAKPAPVRGPSSLAVRRAPTGRPPKTGRLP